MDDARRRRQTWLICLGLALAIVAAYAPVWRAGFINYDDPAYVTANPDVQAGLTWHGIVWALTTGHASNWHPLTWISHMLDVELFGMNPLGHHLTNVVLHLANSVLLFLLLQRMTQSTWPSAMVAALFGLHPMHVESVAWVSERKDVLSTLFWMLSIGAYARWVQGGGAGAPNPRKWRNVSLVLFGLGLAAKPMLVTLPLVLLLLDFWPLQRLQVPLSRLLVEKMPFFILAAASCAATFLAQFRGGTVMPLSRLAFGMRLANALVSCARYLAKLFWPAHLAVAYPMFRWPLWDVAGAVALLLLISAWALWRVRSQPWLAVGWLWFLVTLGPVIGIVQVGMQSMADRYSYIPSIGLFIGVVWAARDMGRYAGSRAPAILGALAAAICLVLTARQVTFWENSETLFEHAIHTTKNNYVAYDSLGRCVEIKGRTNDAIHYMETAVRLQPGYVFSLDDLGRVLLAVGRNDEALLTLEKAVSLDPRFADARYNLGYALLAKGKVGEALDQFQAQVDLEPDDFKARNNMGAILLRSGLAVDAVPYLQKAVEIKPDDAQAHYLLGNALFRAGRVAEAVGSYEKAIQLNPDHVQARNDLAWIRACDPDPQVRNGAQAVDLALRADQLSGGKNPVVIGTLAASYAEAGKFAEAVAAEKRARQAALAQTNSALAGLLEKRLKRYEAGRPVEGGRKVRIMN